MCDAIQTEGLCKRLGDFRLGPIDLQVPQGTVVGLVGSNGAGKTTLIKCLLGLTFPDEGDVCVLGESMREARGIPDALKERIGVVLDTCAFLQESKVADIGRLGQAAYVRWDRARFDRLIDDFAISPKKKVKELSRGMGMKLTLAFALAHHPDLLILDEATAGLDPLARDELFDLLRGFMASEQHAILMATHITTDLEKLADTVVCIDAGQVVFSVTKDAICNEAGIAHCSAAVLEQVVADGSSVAASVPHEGASAAPGRLRAIRREYGTDVLVPDRFAFARSFPDVPIDNASVDDYMGFMLKGELL